MKLENETELNYLKQLVKNYGKDFENARKEVAALDKQANRNRRLNDTKTFDELKDTNG